MLSTLTRRRGFPHRRRFAGTFFGGMPLPVTFPSTPLSTRVYIALGADLTADWLSWNWLDITDRVRHDLGITVTVGRGDERGQVTPSRCTIKVDNNDGYLSRLNPLSPYYDLLTLNTPIWIQLDPGSGFVDQFHGYVNEWPSTWADASGSDAFVTIQCSGVMRRLASDKVLRSPVYRTIAGRTQSAVRPIAYWPMEDGSGSSQFASAVPGVPAVSPAGSVSYASDSDLAGSDPLPTFSTGSSCTFQVPNYTITDAWMAQLVFNIPSDPLVDTVIARIDTGNEGAIARYDVVVVPAAPTLTVQAFDPFGALQGQVSISLDGTGPANPSPADFYGQPWSIRVCEKENTLSPGSTVLFFFMVGADGSDTQSAGSFPSAPSTIRSVTPLAHAATNGITFGHVAVHADAAFVPEGTVTADVVASAGALGGWDGEQAHERIKRLCREEGIPVQALAGVSAAMGPQGSGKLLAELRACEAADQGFLYEWQFGIGYQALSERYDQLVRFELDFVAEHIAGVPQPADDDQRMLNKFTASRSGGSSATAEQETGPFRTGPGGPGEVPGSATVNVETDNQLQPYAGWKVRLGTINEDRWPQLGFHLHGAPDLIPGWLSTFLGHRVTVANPPNPMNPYTIDAVIEGFSYRWDEVSWTAVLNTSPASPYMVGIAGDSTTPGSWPQTGDSTQLQTELASGGTLATAMIDGPLFSTDAADLAASPLSIVVGGEVMPVSEISSVLADAFDDVVVSGWDVADTGQTWTVSGSGSASVSGGFGRQELTAGQTVLCSAGVSLSDLDLLLEGTNISSAPAGDNVEIGARLRVGAGGNNYIQVRTFRQPGGTVTINLNEVVGGSQTATTGFPAVSGVTSTDSIDIRVQPDGNVLRARAWLNGGAEPTTWQVELTANNVLAPGDVTVRGMLGSSWSGASPLTVFYAGVDASNPQSFTVTRTLAKTHPAGSQLAVHRPLVAAY